MESEIIKTAIEQGLWAVLFVSLYFYQLRQNENQRKEAREREDKLTSFITDISKQFEGLVRQYERISEDIEDIKQDLRQK